MRTKTIVLIVVGLLVIWSLYAWNDERGESVLQNDDSQENVQNQEDTAMMMKDLGASEDGLMMEMNDSMMEAMMAMVYEYSGVLTDVTDGKDVRGVNTASNSTGVAKANHKDGHYDLLVKFENLPEPVGTDFYEGWIVRKGSNFNVISSGALKKVGGVYMNTYASGTDLTDHDFYVLTLEPDDGDPSPADHILEGTLVK
jgi:hypothetical protein